VFWRSTLDNTTDTATIGDTPLAYFTAIAKREIALLQISEHSIKHIELLQKCLAILPFILPADKEISRPTLWHLDVHEDNVFVDDEDSTKITSIIDWQNVWAAPLFMQARFPSLVDCPHPYCMGLVRPTLPEVFDTLLDEEKDQIIQEMELKKYYEIRTRRFNPVAYKAMAPMEDDNDPSATILCILGRTRKDGPVPLQELLIQIYENWEAIVVKKGITSACPISFTRNEISIVRNNGEAWAAAFQEFESLRSDLLGKDGWVSHEEYDMAKARYEAHKHELDRLEKKKVDTAFYISQAS
jgi:hypothetical protein